MIDRIFVVAEITSPMKFPDSVKDLLIELGKDIEAAGDDLAFLYSILNCQACRHSPHFP